MQDEIRLSNRPKHQTSTSAEFQISDDDDGSGVDDDGCDNDDDNDDNTDDDDDDDDDDEQRNRPSALASSEVRHPVGDGE